ncbi:uncharacterized protein LOC130798198 [Amaranthus tricolor]|uniref:uncharacterized protein LOC130798198 n=1 Tax=Amaranthus tricolor TaxID=29722 RepID=UPI00258BB1C3|nr:uncharacterized protein LOC130798198 [Amaranthus tricolor]
MDSINVEKIQALKRYKQQQFTKTLLFYSILGLSFSIFCTSPFWFPPLYSCINKIIYIYIPRIVSFFFNVTSIFILGNLIVIFLLGESKIQTSEDSSMVRPIIQQVKSRKRHIREDILPKMDCKIEEQEVVLKLESREEEIKELSQVEEKELENIIMEDNYEEELIVNLSTEELNKRADDFIARVNKQIRLEADREVLSCC